MVFPRKVQQPEKYWKQISKIKKVLWIYQKYLRSYLEPVLGPILGPILKPIYRGVAKHFFLIFENMYLFASFSKMLENLYIAFSNSNYSKIEPYIGKYIPGNDGSEKSPGAKCPVSGVSSSDSSCCPGSSNSSDGSPKDHSYILRRRPFYIKSSKK